MSVEEGHIAVRHTVLNLYSVIKAELGDLDRVERVIKVNGYVNSAPDFDCQTAGSNGALDLLANTPIPQAEAVDIVHQVRQIGEKQ